MVLEIDLPKEGSPYIEADPGHLAALPIPKMRGEVHDDGDEDEKGCPSPRMEEVVGAGDACCES